MSRVLENKPAWVNIVDGIARWKGAAAGGV